MKKTLLAIAMVALGGVALDASAATGTTTFAVNATVVDNCTINSTNIAFGNYDPTSATAVTNASGAVTANCTTGDSVSVGLGQGTHEADGSTAATPARRMASGSSFLPYHIYTTADGDTEWGTGTAGTEEPAAQVSASVGTALSFPLYATIAAGNDVPAGTYTDSVIATVTY